MKFPKNKLLSGTILLTAAGLICRLIGFYYRIFLSNTIGANGLGIYQLVFPLYTLGIAITNSGIHTAISKHVAAHANDKSASLRYLFVGLTISITLCGIVCIPLYQYAEFLSVIVLKEAQCKELLQLISFAIPLECIHGCITGYYYGLQKTVIPSIGQCFEQIIRVLIVFFIYYILQTKQLPLLPVHAIWGLLIASLLSTLYYVTAFSFQKGSYKIKKDGKGYLSDFLTIAIPITASRIIITLMQSAENIFIPQKLVLFGYTSKQAISMYGIFTGMAIPMIFFPSILSNSLAVMLLPSVSNASMHHQDQKIKKASQLAFLCSMGIGFFCTANFFIFGKFIGNYLFHNTVCGYLIRNLSFLCPFFFLNTMNNSILNGLGKTKMTFLVQCIGCIIRVISVFVFVPMYGITAYILGLLLSFVLTSMTMQAFINKILL